MEADETIYGAVIHIVNGTKQEKLLQANWFFPRLKYVKVKEAVSNMHASSVKQFIEQ